MAGTSPGQVGDPAADAACRLGPAEISRVCRASAHVAPRAGPGLAETLVVLVLLEVLPHRGLEVPGPLRPRPPSPPERQADDGASGVGSRLRVGGGAEREENKGARINEQGRQRQRQMERKGRRRR